MGTCSLGSCDSVAGEHGRAMDGGCHMPDSAHVHPLGFCRFPWRQIFLIYFLFFLGKYSLLFVSSSLELKCHPALPMKALQGTLMSSTDG